MSTSDLEGYARRVSACCRPSSVIYLPDSDHRSGSRLTPYPMLGVVSPGSACRRCGFVSAVNTFRNHVCPFGKTKGDAREAWFQTVMMSGVAKALVEVLSPAVLEHAEGSDDHLLQLAGAYLPPTRLPAQPLPDHCLHPLLRKYGFHRLTAHWSTDSLAMARSTELDYDDSVWAEIDRKLIEAMRVINQRLPGESGLAGKIMEAGHDPMMPGGARWVLSPLTPILAYKSQDPLAT